ncbi:MULTISPECIES: hypothetical protein [unclassified Peribacillus]|uniref:hypothetical protein n=1 Tax=unclassified Peribacillus TaxID=2675266 RepID=UPI00366BAEB8
MRPRGNRIEPQRGGNGKGNKTVTFPKYQVGLVVGCSGGSLTFKIYTDHNTVETFTLKDREVFNELTLQFNKLEIIAGYTVGWYFISSEDLDAR